MRSECAVQCRKRILGKQRIMGTIFLEMRVNGRTHARICRYQHVLTDAFQDMVNQAARDAKKRIRLVEYRTQAKDHPILPQSIETKYLKCMILQVME